VLAAIVTDLVERTPRARPSVFMQTQHRQT
jgi:hypothetical protein